MLMPRINFSISSSDRRAPSIRVEAPVEVIKTERFNRPKTCGLKRAPVIHCPFNSSILAILETMTEEICSIRLEKLSAGRCFFVGFWLFLDIFLIGYINYVQLYPIRKVVSNASPCQSLQSQKTKSVKILFHITFAHI